MFLDKIEKLGARCKLLQRVLPGRLPRLDVRLDRRGEYLEVAYSDEAALARLSAVDTRPKMRHALLMYREPQAAGEHKHKFLFGHDERHWFVCAVPELNRGVATVRQAMQALQPAGVRRAAGKLRSRDRLKRRNEAFVRQGEWFFVPVPQLRPPRFELLRHEPLRRDRRSKAHMLELAWRRGGTDVWVHPRLAPRGLTNQQYRRLPSMQRRFGWTRQVRDPELYAKGHVRHKDHATVVLPCWHRVWMNTEAQAPAAPAVVFLD